MKRLSTSVFFVMVACGAFLTHPACGQTVFFEDFEGLELGAFVDETLPEMEGVMDPSKVWTNTPPEGWTVDNESMPFGGVQDWWGWTFANAEAWALVAGNQNRVEFTKGEGTVAIADPDEWDDAEHDAGTMNTFLISPAISLDGVDANTVTLTFDSSWRPEDNQQVAVMAVYDGGDPVELMYWNSFSGDPFFHEDATNETVTLELNNPAGASEVVIRWEMFEAGNDWWWAIDNINVSSGDNVLFTEDFEGLDLGPFQDENLPDVGEVVDPSNVWTNTPPEGWTVDNDWMTPGGVQDWWGWTFANANAWAIVAEDQQRSQFNNASGTVAIADPDEWDDAAHDSGTFNSFMSTPPISIADMEPNSLVLTFDSSWRPEDNQQVAVRVVYDGGEPVELLYWNSFGDDPNFHPDATNEEVTLELNNPAGASEMVIWWEMFEAGNDWWWAIDNIKVVGPGGEEPPPPSPVALPFTEDFEGLALGPNVDESVSGDNVWTKTPPAGWSIDDSGVYGADEDLGVTEWRGWSFADLQWWVTAAEDQRRGEFTNAGGTVAIADPDEWDDKDSPGDSGVFTSFLSTPPISLDGASPNSVVLTFDSSWRDEDTQAASVQVSYDGGEPIEVLRWVSNPDTDPNFHDDAPNETVTVPLNNPGGAQTMIVTWGMLDATNDWWWAIDNVVIEEGTVPVEPVSLPFTEDFEGLALGPNVDESVSGDNVWTKTPPAGWSIDDSGVYGADQNLGVTEWRGWSFADLQWWVTAAEDQRRGEFTNAGGTVAIADPDEWDDKDSPGDSGVFTSFLSTPPISLDGASPNSVVLTFDSSWRDEDTQAASVQVSYDGGEPIEVLRWVSNPDTDPNFHDDAPNETVTVPLNNPGGAQTMIVTWGMLDATNDWWWAIDNIRIAEEEAPAPTPTPVPSMFSEGFDAATVEEAGIAYDAATGFDAGRISIGDVPAGDGTDGRGLILDVGPGEGTLAIMGSPVPVGTGPVLVSVSVQSNGPGCSVALAALNSPIDGQLGYTVSSNTDVPVGEWERLVLLYDPPSDALQPGVQVSVGSDQPGVTVFFDNLTVQELPTLDLDPVALDADGTFETTDGILTNVNNDDGAASFDAGEAVLSLDSANTAANVGIFAGSLQGNFPHLLQAMVDARLVSGTGGVTALVMTNGNGNVGVFVNNSTLPSTITIGGGFDTENSAFPVLGVVQNGGPGVTSSVAVDNLSIYRITNDL